MRVPFFLPVEVSVQKGYYEKYVPCPGVLTCIDVQSQVFFCGYYPHHFGVCPLRVRVHPQRRTCSPRNAKNPAGAAVVGLLL